MGTIRPFDAGGWFAIHNYVFDVIMPTLSPNGWKVLCVAIRQTWGWRAKDDPSGLTRRKWDRISYSQFMEKTGIGGRSTVSRALQECLDAGYLLRFQEGTERGKPRYFYALNRDYEAEWSTGTESEPMETGSKTGPVTSPETEPVATSPETGPVTSPEIGPVTGTETGPTKQRKQTTNKDVADGFSEEQKSAVDALLAFGFQPLSEAKRYVQLIEPNQVHDWLAFARSHGLGPGYVRERFNARDPAPPTERLQARSRSRFITGRYAEFVEH